MLHSVCNTLQVKEAIFKTLISNGMFSDVHINQKLVNPSTNYKLKDNIYKHRNFQSPRFCDRNVERDRHPLVPSHPLNPK